MRNVVQDFVEFLEFCLFLGFAFSRTGDAAVLAQNPELELPPNLWVSGDEWRPARSRGAAV